MQSIAKQCRAMQSNATHWAHRNMCQLPILPAAEQYEAMQSKATQCVASQCRAMQSNATHRGHRNMCQLPLLLSAKHFEKHCKAQQSNAKQWKAKQCKKMQSKAMQSSAVITRLDLSLSVDERKPPN